MFDILRKNNTPSNLIFPMNRLSQLPVLTESLERSVDPYADNKIGTTVNSFINSNDLGHSNNSSSPDDLLSSSSSTNTSESLGIIILLGLGLYSLSLITFFGNAMVVHVIRTEKKLRTVSNMFILSLAIADLTVGLIVMPISSAYVLTGDWIFGLFVCQFWLIIDYIASTASIFNLLILSLDRYWSIKSPLKYLCKRTKKRALAMIVVVWILAACWIIPIIGWHHWYNSGYRKHNGTVCETEFSDDAIFKVTTSVANFLIPMSLMVIIYFKIYNEIKRRGKFDLTGSSSTRNNGNCGNINTASVDGSSVRDEVASIKGYRRTWSSSRRKTPLTNGSSLRSQRKLKNCYSSAINLSSNDCSPSTVPRTTIRIDQASSGETFTADGPSDLVDPVIETNVVSSRSENNLDSDSVHRYEQLIVLKAGSKAYSFEDYKDIEVQVEYIELNPTEPTNRVVPNQSAVDLLKARAARLCQRKTSKPKMSSKNNPSLHKESFKLDKQNRAKNKYLRKNRSTNPQCLTAKPVFTSSRSFHGDLSPDKLSLSSYRNVGLHAGQSKVAGTPGLDRRGSLSHLSSSSMQSHKNVIRRVESSRLRQEKKAARQLGVILGAFIICWLPYVVVFIVTAYCSCINHFIHTMAIWLGYFNSTINPFLYALCNDNFKSAFRKMLARITSSQDNLTTNQSHGASFKFFKSNYP